MIEVPTHEILSPNISSWEIDLIVEILAFAIRRKSGWFFFLEETYQRSTRLNERN